MANLYLSNNSGQIDLAIRCTFTSLTGRFAGPLQENISPDPLSGFSIQDGNKRVGLCVANCALISCKNKVDFKENSDVFLNIPSNRCLHFSGNSSIYSFSCNGTLSVGSGINANFNGLQVYSNNPSIFLKDTGSALDHSFTFRESGTANNAVFSICQSTAETIVSGSGNLTLRSKSVTPICMDGSSVAMGGAPIASYSLTNYGKSLFCNMLNITGTGCIIATGTNAVGLDVNSKSIFRDFACFCSGINILNNCFTTNNCISGTTGYFDRIFLKDHIAYTQACQCFRSIRITGTSTDRNNISGLTCFYDGLIGTGVSCFCSVVFSTSTGINLCLTGGNINLSGYLNMSGGLNICQTATQNVNNVILGCTLTVRATGDGFSQSFFGNVCWSGNMSVTGSGVFNSIRTTGLANSASIFNGCVCLQTPNVWLCAPQIRASDYVCAGDYICGMNAVCSNSGIFFELRQQGIEVTNCFSATGNHFGNNCCGYIKSVNTPKAWGVFSLNEGVPTLLTGYNVCRITIPITGIAASGSNVTARYYPTGVGLTGQWNSPYVMYGLALRETIKAPFTFSLQFHPVGCFDAFAGVRAGYLSAGTSNEMSGYLRTGWGNVSGFGYFSGSSGTVSGLPSGLISTGLAGGSSGLAASWGPLGSYACSQQIPRFSTLVNCAGKNTSSVGNYLTGNFEKIKHGNNYGEIIFSLLPACMTVSRRDYYCLTNNSLNGTGTFTIFSY